jgi:hypothetical protein
LQFLQSLEGVPQLELDEARRADGADNPAESSWVFNIVGGRVAKIGMIPDVEEVRGEPQRLFLAKAEVLD